MELCIVAIFKNEGHALKEWLDHYLREGVDHFFLVDNGSTDGYDIQDYYNKGVEVWINPKKHAQVELTNHYLQKAKQYKWVMVVDLDEFMYARNGFKTIKEYLKTIPTTIHEIQVPWKQFGSSGHIKQPKSIIDGFTRRKKNQDDLTFNLDFVETKSIIRGSHLKKINVHVHHEITKYFSNGSMVDTTFAYITEKILKTSHLHLNHYRIQSWEFFKNVKMSRGDNMNKKNDDQRNRTFFDERDTNDIVDTELKQKRLKDRTHRVRSHRLKTVRRRRIH